MSMIYTCEASTPQLARGASHDLYLLTAHSAHVRGMEGQAMSDVKWERAFENYSKIFL